MASARCLNLRPAESRLPSRAGLGFKPEHYSEIVERAPNIGFWEIHAENYLVDGGPRHRMLQKLRERWSLSVHGVGLSIGGLARPDRLHLARLKTLLARHEPAVFSEHLAWSSHAGICFNDLLPLPYDNATLQRVCTHIAEVQDALGRRLLIENPATYLGYAASTMAEPQFVSEVVARSGCGLLLDINNVYVSATNQGLSPQLYLRALPIAATGEIHLAGFAEDCDAAGARLLIDSHDAPVDEAVWALYESALERLGPVPTLIERDAKVPPLAVLLAEAAQAEDRLAVAGRAVAPRRQRQA